MVDKVWSDWQDKSVKNKYSYGGGSVGAFGTNFTLFMTYPTGMPPHLSVSDFIRSLTRVISNTVLFLLSFFSMPARFLVTGYGTLRFGM